MTTEALIRCGVALAFSLALSHSIYARDELELSQDSSKQRYGPCFPVLVLPAFIGLLIPMFLFTAGVQASAHIMFSICFDVFLSIAFYFCLLLLLLPLLRRYVSARTCAILWLLPNYLYFTQLDYMALQRPRWIITTHRNIVGPLMLIWLIGCLLVLCWKTGSHFLFRRKILQDAYDIRAREIIVLWEEEQRDAGFKKNNLRLMQSPAVRTPLTIGFFHSTIRVILPVKDYTLDEIRLIFRHEIIHIGREDSATKFFLTFCTAMCWFNPLMWIAMRRSADDLELSCDETVLLEADHDTRFRYADLLLQTASDERGFTTCLSTSAKAMQYRLKHIMNTNERILGSLLAGAIFFALILSSGHVAFAYNKTEGRTEIFENNDLSEYSIFYTTYDNNSYDCTDEVAFNTYLANLSLYRLTGNYTLSVEKKYGMEVVYHGAHEALWVTLTDEFLEVQPLNRPANSIIFYHEEDIDWEYLRSLLVDRELQFHQSP